MNKDSILADLRENGYSLIPSLTREEAQEILSFLKSGPNTYAGCHIRRHAKGPNVYEAFPDDEVLCFHNWRVLQAPHLFEYALGLTDIVAEFLGVDPPVMYSSNCFITRPGRFVRPDIQEWHTDRDDLRESDQAFMFLPMFVYLTDVGDDGAQELRSPKGDVRITGPAGTVFLSDTRLMHRGLKPKQSERAIAWFRWGVTPNPGPKQAYTWDDLHPMPKSEIGSRYPEDPRLQESIRLLVA